MKSDVATERRGLEQSRYQKLGNKIKNNTKVILFFFFFLYTFAWVNTIGPKMSNIIHTVLLFHKTTIMHICTVS